MPRSIPPDLAKRAKAIPARILKTEVGEKGKKSDLIESLFERDREKLQGLADYYELRREQSLFLYRTQGMLRVDLDDLSRARKRINASMERDRDPDDPKFEVSRISRPQADGEVILQIRYQKRKHVDKEWDGVVHTHRGTSVATIGLNVEDKYAVVHTRSGKKALACMAAISEALFGEREAATPVIPSIAEQEGKFGSVKPRRATIDNLSLPGTKQVLLKGEDVKKTIRILKDEYDLDFEDLGGQIRYESTQTKKQVRFGADGRLVFPGTTTDRAKVIRKILE